MDRQEGRYLLEFRCRGEVDWSKGSGFRNLKDAKQWVDDTLKNVQRVIEGRIFDWQQMAYRYYRTAFPFKP